MRTVLIISLAVQLAFAHERVVPLGDCDSTFIDETGVVMSPNFPATYAPNLTCTWLIFGSAGKRIQLTFTSFTTEYNVDFVQVFDGPTTSSPLMLNHSGSILPEALISSANSMVVQMTTDAFNQYTGFRAEYEQVIVTTTMAPVPNCGGEMYGSWTIRPPMEENPPGSFINYAHNSNCTWRLQSSSAMTSTIQFDDSFCTEENVDYVEIWEGWQTTGEPVKLITGFNLNAQELTYTSATTNRLTLHFYSDMARNCVAFTAHFS